jgi:hypothetical protein
MITEYLYNLNPKLCLLCNQPISYKNRIGKFCSRSCSCKNRNFNHKHSEETKLKLSNSSKLNRFKRNCKIKFGNCKICKNIFVASRDKPGYRNVCSKECYDIIFKNIGLALCKKHNNQKMYGHHIFMSKYHGEIKLDSGWEVKIIKSLEYNDIKWERGKGFKWIRPSDNTEHIYYPDFYLPDYDIYIEPKNPYRWETDLNFEQTKVRYVINHYNINIIMILNKKHLNWEYIKTKIPLAV